MEYILHGQTINTSGECGIYKSTGSMGVDYAVMDPSNLVATINGMDKDQAEAALISLRDLAEEQFNQNSTPQNLGAPILMQIPPPTPIGGVRDNLRNTRDLASSMLAILKTE